MKKLTAILLAALTAASLCACGSDGGSDSKADSKKSDNTAKSETDASGQEESSGESKKTYTEYEDLSTYERIPSNPGDDEEPYSVYISTPPWRSQNEYGRGLGTAGNMGYTIYDSYDYSLIIAYDNDEVYSGDVKDILPVTFPGFIDLVGCVNASYYDKDLLPEDLMGCVESQEVVEQYPLPSMNGWISSNSIWKRANFVTICSLPSAKISAYHYIGTISMLSEYFLQNRKISGGICKPKLWRSKSPFCYNRDRNSKGGFL